MRWSALPHKLVGMTDVTAIPQTYREPRELTAIDRIATDYYERLLELNPEIATTAGRKGRETEYADYSPAGEALEIQAARDALAALERAVPLDDTDRVTVDAMQERLGLRLEMHEAGLDAWEINNIASPSTGYSRGF